MLPTSTQVPDLGPLGGAAVYTGVLNAAGGAELVRLLLYLHRQLPRGRQHQDDWPVARLYARPTCADLAELPHASAR